LHGDSMAPAGLRAVVFDLGDTLYREEAGSEEAIAGLLSELGYRGGVLSGYSRGYNIFGFRIGFTCEASMRALAHYFVALARGRVDEEEAGRVYREMYRRLSRKLKPVEGALAAVREVKRLGFRLAIVSNASSHEAIVEALRRDGVLGLFDAIVTSALVCVRKPDPRIFLYTLSLLNVKPYEAVYVGDRSFEDVWAAKQVGMRAIHVAVKEPPSPLADMAVRSITEVPDALRALAGIDGG
jgi:putative hydrolase of the HAD superfamily